MSANKGRLGAGMEDVMEGINSPPPLAAEIVDRDKPIPTQFILLQSHGRYLDKIAMAIEERNNITFNRSMILRAFLEGLAKAKPKPDKHLAEFLDVRNEKELTERFRVLFKDGVPA